MEEIWKPIKGYEGIYEVSSYGRVRSLDRHIVRKNDADYRLKGRVLTPKTYKRHYAKVRLIIANVSDNEYHVHRLVADAFVENPKGFPNVRHINGDIHDNRADNLEWCERGDMSECEQGEEWRPAPGHEGKYEVSNLGRVRSIDHYVSREDANALHHGKMLKQYTDKLGYKHVSMWNEEKMKRVAVHQLVAHAFVDGWFEGAVPNHLDENPSNNRADNLAWVTQRENNNWGTRIERVQQRFIESGHARAIVQYDLKGNFIAEYPSVQEASRQTRLNRNSINQCLWGNCKRAKQFIFKYKQ